MKKIFVRLAVISFLITACSKSNEVTQSGTPTNGGTTGNTCDTANMKYIGNIQPILKANCYSCHGNGAVSGGVKLDSYEGVKKQADNGNLMGVITHSTGYPAMPLGGAKLSDCDINKIRAWIADGTTNN